jgi:transposase
MTVPGFGPRLAADFLAATGADLAAFESADRLASFAGLAPVPRDSGKISGNHHRPRRYDRRLLNACFQAAFIAARMCPVSKSFYESSSFGSRTKIARRSKPLCSCDGPSRGEHSASAWSQKVTS